MPHLDVSSNQTAGVLSNIFHYTVCPMCSPQLAFLLVTSFQSAVVLVAWLN
jgi:hypothetical protein